VLRGEITCFLLVVFVKRIWREVMKKCQIDGPPNCEGRYSEKGDKRMERKEEETCLMQNVVGCDSLSPLETEMI
jgi:hypothetical protein